MKRGKYSGLRHDDRGTVDHPVEPPSGYSDYFVQVEPAMQEEVMERTEHGIAQPPYPSATWNLSKGCFAVHRHRILAHCPNFSGWRRALRAVYCEEYGTHEGLVCREVDPPGAPGEGQVKIDLESREIQYSDLVRIRGEYQVSSELPFVIGGDAAGTISEVGPGVTGLSVGDSVLTPGGCIEQINISAGAVTLLPDGVDLEAAASFRGAYSTAYLGMQRADLQAGEVLLVHGAAGGMGLAAVDMGKLYGATVIGTASSDDKLKVVKEMGADHVINYTNGFRDQVKELTGGRGADVIFDPVGGDTFDESMRCIAPYGRILIVGFTGGRPALAKTNHLLVKDASVIGYTIGGFSQHRPEAARRNHRTLLDWLVAGRIHPYISHRLPMEEVEAAFQLIVDRKVIGKVMLS